MTGLFLAQPMYFLYGLAAPLAVGVLYLFYRRFKAFPATGLFLWGVPERVRKGGRKLEPPVFGRSFWLDLSAAFLMALALGSPGCRHDTGAPVVVILDDSYAMRSRDGNVRAITEIRDLAGRARRAGRGVALILAGEVPRAAVGLDAPLDEFTAALEAYDPVAVLPDFPAAIHLAADLYVTPLEFHVFTNRPLAALSAPEDSSLTIRRFAGAGVNLAVTGLWRETDGDFDTLYVNAMRFSPTPPASGEAELVIAERDEDGAWSDIHTRRLTFNDEGRASVAVEIAGVAGIDLAVRLRSLAGGDVIADDSASPAPPPPTRVVDYALDRLSGEAAGYVRHALEAAGAVHITRPGDVPALLATSNPARRGHAATLELLPSTPEVLADARAFLPPFVVDLAHPLARDIHLGSTYWTPALTDGPSDEVNLPLILAGRRPLYWRTGADRLHLDMIPEKSGVVLESAWPALFSNLVGFARDRLPGLRRTLYAPEEMLDYQPWGTFNPGDNEAEEIDAPLSLFSENGRLAATANIGGILRLPRRAGWYTLRQGETVHGTLAVGLPREASAFDTSRLAASDATQFLPPRDESVSDGHRDLTILAVLLALALVFLNWKRGGE